MSALAEALVAAQAELPTVIPRDSQGPALRTLILHTSGENEEETMPLYLEAKTSQAHGSALTYARRYAWAAALGIASEEDTDAATLDASGEEIPF